MVIEALVALVALSGSFYAGKKYGVVAEQKAVAELLKLEGDEKSILAAVKARVSKYVAELKAKL